MNWLRRWMYGRYGLDQLSLVFLGAAITVSIVNIFLRNTIVQAVVFLLVILAFLRVISRNTQRRYQENQAFLRFFRRISAWFRRQADMRRSRKTHKFFKCPACKNTLRVPRGKGKVYITCPKCGERFIGRS